MKSHGKKSKLTMKNGSIPVELTDFARNNEEFSDQRQLVDTEIHIETDQTTFTPDDQRTNNEQQTNMSREQMHNERAAVAVTDNCDNTSDIPLTKSRRIVETTTEDRSYSIGNIVNDMRGDIDPIVGYATEPLLPLFKACAPLNKIIHNLAFYIQVALNETPEQPPNGLTIDESAAIRLYTIEWNESYQSLYSMLNHTLKQNDRIHLRPYFKYLKLFVTALAKLPCTSPSIVWRGVTKNLSAEFPPGTEVTWWSFSSCTSELTVLENNMYLGQSGSRTLFSVETINGRTIHNRSHFANEDEILLLLGTRMIVQSQFSPAPGLYFIHLKQVKPSEVLLEYSVDLLSEI